MFTRILIGLEVKEKNISDGILIAINIADGIKMPFEDSDSIVILLTFRQ